MSQIDFFNEQAALDSRLESVFDFLIAKPELAKTIGNGLRRAFDEVIDGERTGRFCLEELEKTEKTYIGTKVEIVVRNELNLERGEILDNLICGQEVDTKFSLSGGWMIPREAVGHICLLIKGSDNRGRFSVGLLRTSLDVLTKGANQDFKRTISAVGKQRIKWLILEAPMVPNFLLELDPAMRGTILGQKSGRRRIQALFTNVTGQLIPRSAILQVGQQKDSLKRAREAKAILAESGFQVLCGTYEEDKAQFLKHGFVDFRDDDWLSVPMV